MERLKYNKTLHHSSICLRKFYFSLHRILRASHALRMVLFFNFTFPYGKPGLMFTVRTTFFSLFNFQPGDSYNCALCLESYSDKLRHVKKAHMVAASNHKCVKCSFSTRSTQQAAAHAVMWHKGKRVFRSRRCQLDNAKIQTFLSTCFPNDDGNARTCIY